MAAAAKALDLNSFLSSLGFEEYIGGLQDSGYDDLDTLQGMDPDEFKEMCEEVGMKKGHRVKLAGAIRKHADTSGNVATPAAQEVPSVAAIVLEDNAGNLEEDANKPQNNEQVSGNGSVKAARVPVIPSADSVVTSGDAITVATISSDAAAEAAADPNICGDCRDGAPGTPHTSALAGSALPSAVLVAEDVSPKTVRLACELDAYCNFLDDKQDGLRIHYLPLQEVFSDPKNKTSIFESNLPASFGKGSGMKEKVILVVGATGAGKSTQVNGLLNYLLGVEWSDEFRFKLIPETKTSSLEGQAQSQTEWITAYRILAYRGAAVELSLTIIDTPGFGDTRGIQRDELIMKQLKSFFSPDQANTICSRSPCGVAHLDGICFIAQASLPRLTSTQKYIFDSILSIFGKDIADNIVMCYTFSDGQRPQAIAAVEAAGIPHQSWFKFNNSALFVTADSKDVASSFDQMFWQMGVQSFEKFFTALQTMQPASLVLTRHVMEERELLETAVAGLQPQIQSCLGKVEELRQEARVCKQMEAEMDANKDFVFNVPVPKIDKVDLKSGTYTTNCMTCNMTCHCPCIIPDDKDKSRCGAMDQQTGMCKICPQKCHWSQHKNMPFKIVVTSVPEKRTSTELKARYETASSGKLSAKSILKRLTKELSETRDHVFVLVDQMRCSRNRLCEIALRPEHLSSVDYIDVLIQTEEAQANHGWLKRREALLEVRKQAETMIAVMKEGYDPMAPLRDDTEVLTLVHGLAGNDGADASAGSWGYASASTGRSWWPSFWSK